jgi:hypothetical protein
LSANNKNAEGIQDRRPTTSSPTTTIIFYTLLLQKPASSLEFADADARHIIIIQLQ